MPPYSPEKRGNSTKQNSPRIVTGSNVTMESVERIPGILLTVRTCSGSLIVQYCFFAPFHASGDICLFYELDFYWKNLMRIPARKSSCLPGRSESYIWF